MQRISPLVIFIVASFTLVGFASCVRLYTIVAPQHIRPHHSYKVSLTLHDDIEPVTIRLSIEDGLNYKNERNITITSNKTELVALYIDNLNASKGYKFVAEGLTGIIFRNEAELKIESKDVSIFIQTDKAIYKPSETIKFRVLVLDYELKPITLQLDSSLDIYFTDPEKNRIKQWLNVTLNKGVFTSEVMLSESPILGNWKFEARIGTEKKAREIEVAEYVLPLFDVIIDSPSEFSAKNDKIRAIVRSKYTYGKFVKGEATVSLSSTSQNAAMKRRNEIIKTIPIDGKGTVEFDVENDLKEMFTKTESKKSFELKARVIEELTGLNQSTSKIITLHQTRYKIEALDLRHEFTPGTPIKFSIRVSHHDNSPILLNEATKTIKIQKNPWFYVTISNPPTYYTFELNQSTTAVNIEIPTLSNGMSFGLKVKYMDEELDLGRFNPATVKELETKVLTKSPKLNENIVVEVKSKRLLQHFTYQVIGNGRLIYAENVVVPNRTDHVIKFKATFDLVPKATLIVYRVENSDIIATKNEISIDDDLNNFVKLKLSTTETQPSTNVSIDVSTNAESYVGLVGVDQSVLLLKKNFGLTKQDAFDEIISFQKNLHPTKTGPWNVKSPKYLNEYFRPFEHTNLILFTNAKQEIYKPPTYVLPYDRNCNPFEYDPFNRRLCNYRPWFPINHTPRNPAFRDSAFGHSALISSVRSQSSPSYPHSAASSYPFNAYNFAQSSLPTMPSYSSYSKVVDKFEETSHAPVEPTRIRTEFPETWLWEDIDMINPNGTLTLSKKVPDTITSWVISAFSVSPQFGLGLTKSPKTLNVFQPFFVSLNLPYSVKRGEVVAVPVVLFNYLNTDITAELVVHNENGEFVFIDDIEGDQLSRKRQVSVDSDSGVTQTFLVRFTSIGQIPLKVTATSAVAGDAVIRILQVDPEGVPQFINKAMFIDLRESDKFETTQMVDVPDNAVPDSLKINVNAIGDLLGGTIQNLHQLIRLPTGCGEQNMLKFVPNIVVLDYLKAVGNLDATIKETAIKYLLTGYQRELTYRHSDGSYSVFGKSDNSGSTWLTAFVAKSFKQAEEYIDIESDVIDKALEFLSRGQAADGSFPEVGRVYDKAMQGGASKGIALTAYTTIAFLKNKQSKDWKYEEVVNKAISNIVQNLKDTADQYALAIAVYALQLANHSMKEEALQVLIDKSIAKDQMKWWTNSKPNERASDTIDVEITSYGLLALIEGKRYVEGLPYFRWLLNKRNDRGGFTGTQDTVIGLESLAAYSRLISSKANNVELRIHGDNRSEDRILTVNNENGLVLQTIDLPSNTESVQLSASGRGFALFQLSYRYNLNQSDVYEMFTLKPKVIETTAGHLNVEICSRFNPKSGDENHSNMVIVEVGMPSGFLIDKEKLNELLKKSNVKLVETTNGETVAHVYFDQMLSNEEICLKIQGYRSHKVAENKPVPVKIYDYYDSSRSAREFYEIPFISSCDICEGDECSKSCKEEMN
ncbi:CD109 antigen-like [Contarinia nasturtii]|uniref:CD109 antigen-like n=1 Tax=Contarinia nasturtii TaxID=265458 RepID=UPI0012D49958|nr:CD109 antigen-like [Contarinia nasturtii]